MPFPTAKDPLTQVPVARVTSGEGDYLLPYYTSDALSADGRFLACSHGNGESIQACLVDLETGEERRVSEVPGGILDEAVAFHRSRNWLLFAGPKGVWWYDLESERTELVHDCANTPYWVKSEISVGEEYAVFFVHEKTDIGRDRTGNQPPRPALGTTRSFIIAAHIESGESRVVWSDHTYLAHPVISPLDDNVILFADQGVRERLQELFIVSRVERDGREPLKLYQPYKQRPTYVGHSFFTRDGWVGTQGMQFGGMQPDGSYPDMYGFNGVIKIDGNCDRRARCPGGNKPLHCHAAYADSWWVGDALTGEGTNDPHSLCIMKNNWETGYVQAEPLCAHGCTHDRPFHVHPRFAAGEKLILFNSNYRGNGNVYIAYPEEFLANWQDRVPFAPRRARNCLPPREEMRSPKRGPEA